ncbi:MAG: Hsp70 family protein [Proteobacteria bacterium]|nr:Hsp70 family protein [Pseudomonadota bacterium]
MALSIGIDLGTTNSVAAVATPTGVEFALDANGERIHPSVVAFPGQGGVLVGRPGREHLAVEGRYTVYSAKRLIGKSMRSPTVQLAVTGLPYRVDEGPNEQPMIVIRDQQYTIPEISAHILTHLRNAAQRQLGEEVREAVITVPANFTDAQRQATREAGRLAGLDVLRLINEPTAAALAYGYGRELDAVVAVYDFGGGTFDISLLEVRGQIFEVLATQGEVFLGGDDLDRALAEYLAEQTHRSRGIDLRHHPDALTRLVMAAEEIKCHLSREDIVEGTIDNLPAGSWETLINVPFRITREQFEDLVEGYVDQTIEVCRRTMVTAGLEYRDVNDVICVGGSTRVPLVRRRLSELFGRLPSLRISPDEVVAHGAAIQAGSLSGRLTAGTGMATTSVLPAGQNSSRRSSRSRAAGGQSSQQGMGSGVHTERSDLAVGYSIGDSRPARHAGEKSTGTTARIDPLIASALDREAGTASTSRPATPGSIPVVQSDRAVPTRPLLLDVTPAALSVALAGGYTDCILRRNAPIPIERTKMFTTARHNQRRVVIECCRGAETRFADNERLGTLVLDDLPPAPRGEIEIAVTFRVDADGILHVRAWDTRTGAEQRAQLNVLGAPVTIRSSNVDAMSQKQP